MDTLLHYFEAYANQLDAHWIAVYSRDAKWIEIMHQVRSKQINVQVAIDTAYSATEMTTMLNNHSMFHMNNVSMQKKCLECIFNDSQVKQNLFVNKKQLTQNYHFIMHDLVSLIVGYECVQEMLSNQVCTVHVWSLDPFLYLLNV